MAESVVTLRVDARNAISSLNNTSLATKKLTQATKGTTRNLHAASAAAKGLGTSLMSSLAPLITVGAAFATVGNAIGTFTARTRDVEILRQGLENLGKGAVTLTKLQEAADKLGNQTLFNQEEFTRGFNLLTSFRKIGVDSYERVAQAAADIAQVNQVDVSTSFMQLAKALQDPERNLSNLNRSGIAFTKQQQDVIKELMKTNKTAEAHAMILEIVEESYNGLAQAASQGLAGNLDSLGETFRDFSETLGEALEPALIASVKGLTQLIKAAEGLITSPLGKTIGIFTGIAAAAKGLPVLFTAISIGLQKIAYAGGLATIALNAIPFVALATGAGLLTTALIKANEEQKKFNELVNKGGEEEVTAALEAQSDIVNELSRQHKEATGRDKKALARKLKEAELEKKMLEGRLTTIQSDKLIEESANKIVKLKEEANKKTEKGKELTEEEIKAEEKRKKEEKKKKEAFDKYIARQEQSGELLQAAIDGNQKEVQLQHDINNAVAIHGEHNRQKITDQLKANQLLRDQKTEIDKNAEAAEELKGKFAAMGQEIEDGIVQNLTDAVMGTQTLAEAAIKVLDQMKRKLVELAIQKAFAGIGGPIGGFFGSLFGRANGGRVSANQPYMVGERGREVFVPTTSGTIVPNNQLGGGTTNVINVSVDASGTQAEGDEATSSQLGKLIGLAVQQELVKQSRAGGLLSRA